MKSKKLTVFLIVLLAFGLVTSYAETKKWRRTGSNTFVRIKGKVPTAEVMKTLADKYAGDIKIGMDQVGQGDLYEPVLQALKDGVFTEASLPAGEKFAWMFFRLGGKVKVWTDVEWAGKKPLDVFLFDVKTPTKLYTYAMPRPCGNLALYKAVDVIPPAPPATCLLVVNPMKANLNEPVVIDMCGTQNAASMTVEIFDAQGVKIASRNLTPADCKWQTSFDKAGSYVFKGAAVNADGVASSNPCEVTAYINAPPTCKLWTSCLPCEDYVGKPITFDANGSTDPDGQLVKAVFEITDETGNVIDSYTANAKPFTWQKVFTKAGKYGVNVSVFDDMGAASSTADPCHLTFDVTQKKFFWVAEIGGLLARGTYTGFFFGRVGMLWGVVPDLMDIVLTMGPAIPSQGDPWKVFFMGNVTANLHLGPSVYVGAGLGYTTKEQETRKSGIDLVGQFGVNIFNHYTSAGSIFAEARIPVLTSDRPVDDHYKLLLGFRYIF